MKIAEAIFKIKELRITKAKKSSLVEKLVGKIREIPEKKKNQRLIEVLNKLSYFEVPYKIRLKNLYKNEKFKNIHLYLFYKKDDLYEFNSIEKK